MFRTRLISGIVLVVLLMITGLLGGPVLYAGVLIIALIAVYEMLGVMQLKDSLIAKFAYVGTVLYYFMIYNTGAEYLDVFIIAYLMVILAVYVFTYPKYKTEQMLAVFFGVFYVAVMLSYVYQTRMLTAGAYIVWLIFLCSWGCDTCAYCVGMLIGKHKMSPKLSPKKSVEGAIGGVVGAALLTVIYGMIFKNAMGVTTQHVWIMAAISAVGALISMVGDLTASAIKRNYEIKDYGKLIPGHGGILDRFDSVIFTAPMIYFLAANFIVL